MPRHKQNLAEAAPKPKGPANAFAFFVKICRDEHKRRHSDEVVDRGEFIKKCGERWKTMTAKEKNKFNQMQELDKKRFQTEMQVYNQSQDGVKKKRIRKAKDPRAPKRSMSAFFWFAQDERPKVRASHPNYAVGDIAKELGRRWADAAPKIKSIYEGKAEKDRERYIHAKQEFQQKLKDEKKGIFRPENDDSENNTNKSNNSENSKNPDDSEEDDEDVGGESD